MQIPYKLALIFSNQNYSGVIVLNILLTSANLFFFYLIVKTVFRLDRSVALLGMSIYAFYSADGSTLALPMMVVKFSTLFYLLAVYVLLKYRNTFTKFFLVILFQLISIFTYDAIIILFLASFLLILLTDLTKRIYQSFMWVSAPLISLIFQLFQTYFNNEQSYQSSQLDFDITISQFIQTFLNLSYNSLFFPVWPITHLEMFQISEIASEYSLIMAYLSITIILTFLVLKFYFKNPEIVFQPNSTAIVIILFLSSIFPYALIKTAFFQGVPWRSVLHSSIPGSILLLLIFLLIFQRSRILANVFISSYFILATLTLGIDQVGQKQNWADYLNVVSEIKREVPDVRSGSLILLFEKKSKAGFVQLNEIFPSNIWFNSALQLAYPQRIVVGAYFSSDQKIANDIAIDFQKNKIVITYSNVGVEKQLFEYNELIILEYFNKSIDPLPSVKLFRNEYILLEHNNKLIISRNLSGVVTPLLGELVK